MRLITDKNLVERNAKIGQYAFTGGTIILLGALAINLYAITQPADASPQLLTYVIGGLLVGYLVTQVGTMFRQRWGMRSDKGFADALRGLDERYTLYNYRFGANHVFVGPSGAYVFVPKYQYGLVAYDAAKKRWHNPQQRRGFLNLFGTGEGIGNPEREAEAEIETLKAFLKKQAPDIEIDPKAIVVFMHTQATLKADNAPITALHFKQLKEHLRRQPKGQTIPLPTLQAIEEKLGVTPAQA
jgi:hypothetical protein